MRLSLLLSLGTFLLLSSAWAQQDSAPQEAPYVQEDNEFDAFSNDSAPPGEEADALSIEEEIKSGTVNLNEPSEKKLEDELQFDEPSSVVEPARPVEPVIIEPPLPPPTKAPRPRVKTAKDPRGGYEYIEHPQAKKGLKMITKEGTYIYRTAEKKKYDKAGAFRVGLMDPPKITAADGTSFSQMYSSNQQPLFSFDFEWQPFQSFGRLGVQAGFGFMLTSGAGRFLDGSGAAQEKYTFVAAPLNLGVVYRFEFMSRQWVTPYAAGGGTYIGVAELRDDGKLKTVGTPGVYGGGGLLINISSISRETGFTLQSEYGIMNLWLSLDYKYLASLNDDLNFSSSIMGLGVVCDY